MDMVHNEYLWKAKDRTTIYGQCWQPDTEPVAIINLIHGLGEHSSRYEHWATRFTEEGYAVVSIDYRGHGKSGGKKGHAANYKKLMNDITLLNRKSAALFPEIPVILYGHSLGGNLAINYVMRNTTRKFAALIVTSPWLKLARKPPKIQILAAKIIDRIFPSLTQSNGLSPKHLTHDEHVVKTYKDDPLVHNRISVHLFLEVNNAAKFALKSIYKINIPFLLMHGSKDKITSHLASQIFVENTSKKTTFKLWEGMFHELHNETENDKVFRFIHHWLEEVIQEKSTKMSNNGYF